MDSVTNQQVINERTLVSIGTSVQNNKLTQTTLAETLNTIQNSKELKDKIHFIREIEAHSVRQEKKKEILPYFIPGTFRDNVRRSSNLSEISFMIFDYDHISIAPDEAFKKITSDKMVFAAFRSPSGDGFKVIYRLAQPIKTPDQYSRIYKHYANHFNYELGAEPDKTSDASRACFFSYDPQIYVNTDADMLAIDIPEKDLTPAKEKADRSQMLENIRRIIPAGNPRTPTLTSLISMFIRQGIDREFAMEFCKRWNRVNEKPHPDSKIEYTVNDMYDRSWKKTVAGRCENFYSFGTGFYETSIVGDEFSIKEIGKDKFFIRVEASKDEKDVLYSFLVKKKHINNLRRIDYVSDTSCTQPNYDFNWEDGVFTVHIPPRDGMVCDNDFIEKFLEDLFGTRKKFIKEWLATFFYTNYKKLPFIILMGDRGTGKNTFVESIFSVIPTLSVNIKELGNNFNPYLEKKLVILDESDSQGKLQYQELKKLSGQKYAEINKKYAPQYTVRNNLNMIILSNDYSPISVSRGELPTDENNNQFFVHRIKNKITSFDPSFDEKLSARWYHYIMTELKSVFESLNFDGKRYAIATPITEEEKELFQNGATDTETEVDRLIAEITSDGAETATDYYEFLNHGILPSDYFKPYTTSKITRNMLVQDLRRRGFLTNDNAGKYKYIKGKRPLSYKLTDKAMAAIQAEKEARISFN